ncbi:hypothetical protein [Streptomyces sp. NPDC059378]|uniref:hypothetical protein n=1 Tax=Streptomyces sp. NPDC059378 TaxID=3346815 RepID=UPI0036AFAD6E
MPAWFAPPEPTEAGGCRVRGTTGDPMEWLAMRLAVLGYEFEVREPAELAAFVRELGGRLVRAGGG